MGKGGVAIAAQKKRDESYTVAEPAAGGSLKRVRSESRGRPPIFCSFFSVVPRVLGGLGSKFSEFGWKHIFVGGG